MKNKRINITADDFGLSEEINKGILELCGNKIITRVSVMVTCYGFEEWTKKLFESAPHTAFAVHLNITDGTPVSSISKIPTLVNHNNEFFGGKHYLVALLLTIGAIRPREVITEWRAQIQKAIDSGISINQLNSHGHLHLHPKLHDGFVSLIKEFRIPSVRLINSMDSLKSRAYQHLSRILRNKITAAKIPLEIEPVTIGIGKEGRLRTEWLIEKIEKNPEAKIDIITHPATNGCSFHKLWGWEKDLDFQALVNPLFSDYLIKESH